MVDSARLPVVGRLCSGGAGRSFEDDYYAEYMDGDYDDLYKYGFRMNNYASVYSDRFVVSLAREYGMPRADLRYYLRKGYSPSDL